MTMFVDNAEENEKRALFAIGVVEITVIFPLNAFTAPIYTSRNRHLRMLSTLIINLTVSEFLVGTVAGLSLIFLTYNLKRVLVIMQAFSW